MFGPHGAEGAEPRGGSLAIEGTHHPGVAGTDAKAVALSLGGSNLLGMQSSRGS
jgi:hypothetical protein